jgi:hypothetical protein
VNFTMAKVKFSYAAGTAATSESGVGALAATYLTISAAGNAVAGVVQTAGALSGETKGTEEAAEGVSTITSLLGFGTLIKTGDMNKAALAAAAEGIVTSKPKDLATGGNLERVAKAADFIQNVRRVEGAIKNSTGGRRNSTRRFRRPSKRRSRRP